MTHLRHNRKLEREKKTLRQMMALYCQGNHQTHGKLCNDCEKLFEYASLRINGCRFGAVKPVCSKCRVHCYKQELRQKIKRVMRYAGPKMILHHPLATFRHLLDSWLHR